MVPGQLKGQARLTSYPTGAPFWTLALSDVPVSAMMCLDCGFIELRGDVERARQLLHRNETTDE